MTNTFREHDLERLEHGPCAHGVGSPDDQVDEDNPEDVAEHSGDADYHRTQVFIQEKTAHYPEMEEHIDLTTNCRILNLK